MSEHFFPLLEFVVLNIYIYIYNFLRKNGKGKENWNWYIICGACMESKVHFYFFMLRKAGSLIYFQFAKRNDGKL